MVAVFNKDSMTAVRRNPYDVGLMLKILIPQPLYNPSEHHAEFQINDRQSFRRLWRLQLARTVQDFATVWNIREPWTVTEVAHPPVETYAAALEKQGTITKAEAIIDTIFVKVTRQRTGLRKTI